uniref:hypothetical protein n=1 Tax=Marinobacterium profundum TaxID=1714300 RepID=UPI00082FFD27|nr:hypothetical protein [Marinobacterium profundum]
MVSILMQYHASCRHSFQRLQVLLAGTCHLVTLLTQPFALITLLYALMTQSLSFIGAARGRHFHVIPPSLLSIYLFNQKQTKLFTLVNA